MSNARAERSMKPARVILIGLFACLAGCAVAGPGTVLGTTAPDPSQAAFLTVTEEETFWIQVLPADRHALPPAPVPVTRNGLWVTEGVFQVKFLCYSPRKAERQSGEYPIIPNSKDQRSIEVHAGHRYRLRCSDDKVGVFKLQDLTGRTSGGER